MMNDGLMADDLGRQSFGSSAQLLPWAVEIGFAVHPLGPGEGIEWAPGFLPLWCED